MARHLFLAALAVTWVLGTTVTEAKSPAARTTILDEPVPTTEAGKDALLTRLWRLDDTSVLAVMCKARTAGWGSVVEGAVRQAGQRVFGPQWGVEDPEQCQCFTLGQAEHMTMTSWAETPEEDCAEARKDWANDLREGDAIVKKLRPNGVDPWEGLARVNPN